MPFHTYETHEGEKYLLFYARFKSDSQFNFCTVEKSQLGPFGKYLA